MADEAQKNDEVVKDDQAATAEPAETDGELEAEEESAEFEVGEVVFVRRDFHSRYFRGLSGKIEGPPRKGGTSLPLWPVRLDVPPRELMVAAKHLQRKSEYETEIAQAAERSAAASGSDAGSGSKSEKKSLLSRLIPWGR